MHGIFPFVGGPRYARQRHVARLFRHRPRDATGRVVRRTRRLASRTDGAPAAPSRREVSLFVSEGASGRFSEPIPELRPFYDWDEVLARVDAEQGAKRPLRVVVYPCAPLQVLPA